jgi:hypothetical protein
MSLDFQQVRQQVNEMGENASARERQLRNLREKATETLEAYAHSLEPLRQRVEAAVSRNPNMRCALPVSEILNGHFSLPSLPDSITLLAADGSQINPDRHASVDYCLVNVGAIQMTAGSPATPVRTVRSRLLYDDEMYTENGRITERLVALMRDLRERELLAELAENLPHPIITLTDGPLELWPGQASDPEAKEFEKRFKEYLAALRKLQTTGASTAGYIDKPGSDLLVRLLEIADLPLSELNKAGKERHFRGITDVDLLQPILGTYERSAVLGIQSRFVKQYADDLALHFFYLNVGATAEGRPYLARVEIPAWVANSPQMLNDLHAMLIHQCQTLGSRPYPYLLHRSHEVALVSMDEKKQVENMIAIELRRRGVAVGYDSNKQYTKDVSGQRTKY